MRAGKELIKKWEGLRLDAYLCPAQKWTIGYGATFYEDGTKVKRADRISKERAEGLLNYHYDLFENDVKLYLKVNVNENQLGALVSFAYNLGVGNLQKSTLLRLVNEGKFHEAANEFDKWVYANKVKLNGLVNRRAEEKQLFLQPVQKQQVVADEVQITESDKEKVKTGLIKLFKGLFGNKK